VTDVGTSIATEELLAGDDMGDVYYYSVVWPDTGSVGAGADGGRVSLMARISIHTQKICGISWSPQGDFFATGGNDSTCCLFEVRDILEPPGAGIARTPLPPLSGFSPTSPLAETATPRAVTALRRRPRPQDGLRQSSRGPVRTSSSTATITRATLLIMEGGQRHKWAHSAAVKAIAFCPWQRGLLATGGGSNDRAIHFYHTWSGACLATIGVQAQVTSLIWSTTRREIAATFGYSQPEHPYRIAVFSWPECKQVIAIPCSVGMRALYAIPYPGGPNESTRHGAEGGRWCNRTREEGCIVVACSDESVKFYEVWIDAKKGTSGRPGLLGGSDILEELEGMENEGGEAVR
jgi:meiosis-specific APC/C activator protein AMA1